MNMRERLEQLRPYKDRILFAAIALVVGILWLTIGFWKTLLLAILTGIGFLIGSYKDGTLGKYTSGLSSFLDRR